MRKYLIAMLLSLYVPLSFSEALPGPKVSTDSEAPALINVIEWPCMWMLKKYQCIIVEHAGKYFLIYRDEKGTAYKWTIEPDGTKDFDYGRDSI